MSSDVSNVVKDTRLLNLEENLETRLGFEHLSAVLEITIFNYVSHRHVWLGYAHGK